MSICTAREFYRKHASAVNMDEIDLVDMFRKIGWKNGLNNDNYVHALFLTDLMFRNTFTSMSILAGAGADDFLRCLSKSFEALLDRLKKWSEGLVRIVIVDGEKGDYLNWLSRRYEGTLSVKCAQSAPTVRIGHFIFNDSGMLRKEQYHDPLDDESSAGEVKAKVYLNNPTESRIMWDVFDTVWKNHL